MPASHGLTEVEPRSIITNMTVAVVSGSLVIGTPLKCG
jgi:hypothetical protein